MHEANKHWNDIFLKTSDPELGWYEQDVTQTMKFINAIEDCDCQRVFLPGAGTSLLVDELIARDKSIILNDISSIALDSLRTRIGQVTNDLEWLCQDIARPMPTNMKQVDLWIDRAVLHFLLKESDIDGYFNNLRSAIKIGGYALLAEFSPDGAPKCAGLTLHRYSIEEMEQRLGDGFECIRNEYYTYTNPSGDPRPYVYGLFKRVG